MIILTYAISKYVDIDILNILLNKVNKNLLRYLVTYYSSYNLENSFLYLTLKYYKNKNDYKLLKLILDKEPDIIFFNIIQKTILYQLF